MRMLELIGRGYSLTNALFHLWDLRRTRVFGEWENGYLLDGLALGPTPAGNGLDNALRTISRENLRDRQTAYHRSELTLSEFGKSILAHKEDFSRHNPIDRWWGGTRLTNARLWRWDPVLTARPANHASSHWLNNVHPRRLGEFGNDIGLADLFERCEAIDL
jgi:hypothetical protein